MEFLSYLISGISLGSVYAIIALGYTMVYGIAKMLNFAHGDIIMVGGYISFCAMNSLGLPSIVAVLLAMVVCTVLGVVIEGLAYKPLRAAPSLAVLITAIGVSYFLQNAAQLIWSAAPKVYSPVVTGSLSLLGGQLSIPYVSILTVVTCLVIMAALTTFTSKSKMGKAMRACSEDRGAAQLMGINVNATISTTFAIGSALAAIAGVLLCSSYGTLMPTTGSMPGIKAFTAAVGFIVGVPVLRLRGDYLAIVTLAFGEIIKDLVNCLLVGYDSNGLHMALNLTGNKSITDLHLEADGIAIIKGAQGATGTTTIASFTAGFVLVMLTLVIVLNLVRSRTGRAVMAIRDNRIAAESVGINVTKYKLIAFVTSAALAGAAGALYGLNFSSLQATKFNFNTSILVLVFVVLGGLGHIWGSVIAATVLTILPEALRGFDDYRMLIYAIVLILVMLATNNAQAKALLGRIIPKRKGAPTNG